MSSMRLPVLAVGLAIALGACERDTQTPAATPPRAALAPAPSAAAPSRMTSADVDARLRAEWQRAGVTPTAPADDATWLRRAYIDVLGTIPPPELVRHFLADTATDKRTRALDDMLASPLYADHWTAYWDDVLMGRDTRGPQVDRGAFRAWLHDAFARNAPWNEMVVQLVAATGRNSSGGPKAAAYAADGKDGESVEVNGAVNWTLKYQQSPQDLAGAASRELLGVQIQCAQCHDHKTEKWTQQDFQSFANAFARTRLVRVDDAKMPAKVQRIDVRDLDRPAPRFAKTPDFGPIARAKPSTLDGTDLSNAPNVRAAMAAWMTSAQNPWFSHAIVNRMWGHFVGRGFVDPVDDLRPSNAPTAPALYDALASDFAAGGYDLKRLVRVIVGSEAYARSAAPLSADAARADPEVRLWERFRLTPLAPEELLDALVVATKLDAVEQRAPRLDLAQVRFRVKQRYGFLFDVDEESDATDYEGTIAQALALLNGSVVAAGDSTLPGSAIDEVLAMPGGDAPKVEALYLRALSRLPTRQEIDHFTRFVAAAQSGADAAPAAPPSPPPAGARGKAQPDPLGGLEKRAGSRRDDARARAWEDVLWALVNSSEFALNH
jgi:hypothetical protein